MPLCWTALLLLQEPLPLELPPAGPKVEIGGRVMIDTAFVGGPGADEVGAALGEELMDGAEVRRARLDVRSQLAPGLRGWLGLEFAGGKTRFREASLAWSRSEADEWKLGYFKQPFFLDQYGSSNDFVFLEAPLGEDTLTPGRNSGLLYSHWGQAHSLGASVYRKIPETTGISENEGYGATGRAVWRPFFEPDRGRLLHLAANLGWENPDDQVSFSSRPEQHLLPVFLDTGPLDADSVLRYGVELAGTMGRWHGAAEWMGAGLEDEATGDPGLSAWNVYGGCYLSGESRAYDRKKGTWSRLKPAQDYQPGHWDEGRGAWEAVGRISLLDMTETGDGELEVQSLGLNWHWSEHVRVLLTLNRSLLDDYDAVYSAALRVGFDF
jgi:phosphate-selective porin OprO/OprP